MIKIQFRKNISECLLDEYNNKNYEDFTVVCDQKLEHTIEFNIVEAYENIFCLLCTKDNNNENQMLVYVHMIYNNIDNSINPIITEIIYNNIMYEYDIENDCAYITKFNIQTKKLEKTRDIIDIICKNKIGIIDDATMLVFKDYYNNGCVDIIEVLDFIYYINKEFWAIFTANQFYVYRHNKELQKS